MSALTRSDLLHTIGLLNIELADLRQVIDGLASHATAEHMGEYRELIACDEARIARFTAAMEDARHDPQ